MDASTENNTAIQVEEPTEALFLLECDLDEFGKQHAESSKCGMDKNPAYALSRAVRDFRKTSGIVRLRKIRQRETDRIRENVVNRERVKSASFANSYLPKSHKPPSQLKPSSQDSPRCRRTLRATQETSVDVGCQTLSEPEFDFEDDYGDDAKFE